MIYLFQELDLISNELLHQMIFSLPVARREYVQHFKLPGNPGFPENLFWETIFPWGKYAVF